MLEKSTSTLFDEKQLIADIHNEKINALDLSAMLVKDEKAEMKTTATLRGHKRSIDALTVLPDGRLASGSRDKTIRLWDVGLRPIPLPALQKVLMQLESNTSVRQVNLQHTLFNDEGVAELAAIFQTNRAVTELNLCNTQVTAKGVETFYKLLPPSHPLRQGLHHEAMKSIYCKEILENFFSYSLINLMLDYAAEEIMQPATQTPFAFTSDTSSSTQQTPSLFFNTTSSTESKTSNLTTSSVPSGAPANKR